MNRKILVYATISSLIWGASFPITKIALNGASPIMLAFLRYGIASSILIPFLFPFKIKIKDFVLLGLFSVTFPTILQNVGLKYTHAYISGFIQSTGPLYTLILAYLMLKEKITKQKIAGLIIAISATYFVVSPQGGGNVAGNLLVLFSAISYSAGGIIAKNLLNRGYKAIQLLSFSSFSGAIFLIPCLFLEEIKIVYEGIALAVFLAIVTTLFAYILWYSAMEKIEVSRLSFFTFMMPLFSVIFSGLFLNEKIKILTIVSGFIAIFGILIAQQQ
ncbi:MAG: DMT family transporter [Thermoplasmatales archaeon]|nr:DMT family transporter [Thermoplasmatales archaeon]